MSTMLFSPLESARIIWTFRQKKGRDHSCMDENLLSDFQFFQGDASHVSEICLSERAENIIESAFLSRMYRMILNMCFTF